MDFTWVSIGLQVDSKAGSSVEPLQWTAECLHGVEFGGEPGGWTGEGDSLGFEGARESRLRDRAKFQLGGENLFSC